MTPAGAMTSGELNAAITREVILALRSVLGRGPRKAYSFHRGKVVTVLEGPMTPGELKLAGSAEREALRTAKRALHRVAANELTDEIRRLTGLGGPKMARKRRSSTSAASTSAAWGQS